MSVVACVGALPPSVCEDAALSLDARVGPSDATTSGTLTSGPSEDGALASTVDGPGGAPTSDSSVSVSVGDAGTFDVGPGWRTSDAGVTVDSLTDGGFAAVQCIELATMDLALDPMRGLLYVTVPATSSDFGNGVVRIDPSSAIVTGAIFVGSNPNSLAVSDDGSSLYVGIDGTSSVRRVNLATGGVQAPVYLGSSTLGARTAGEIRAVPGSQTNYVVSRRVMGYSPSFAGLALFDGPTLLGEWNGFVGGERFAFASPSILYGYNDEDSGYDLYEFTVDATGFQVDADVTGLVAGATKISGQGGWIFATNGQVVDGATTQPAGRYAASGPVWAAADGTNVWFLETPDNTGAVSVPTLLDFDRATFLETRSIPLPGATIAAGDTPTSLVGWSSTGFAFRTQSSVCIATIPP